MILALHWWKPGTTVDRSCILNEVWTSHYVPCGMADVQARGHLSRAQQAQIVQGTLRPLVASTITRAGCEELLLAATVHECASIGWKRSRARHTGERRMGNRRRKFHCSMKSKKDWGVCNEKTSFIRLKVSKGPHSFFVLPSFFQLYLSGGVRLTLTSSV
jgi:hypothetical protein